ncbi:MAG: DUF2782 domain-containing protein [Gammaproteobacteria bacterium]|nr:DUF2782 domain-containing protein [Gammaproteobacteria bacterium]
MPTKHDSVFAIFIAGGALLSSMPVLAADPEAVPEPPEIPPALVDGEAIEPEVTIIKKEESTIYEYRVNGQLYMVKVQPIVGPPYYLVDRDGDGEFDSRSTDPETISVPQWILLRW